MLIYIIVFLIRPLYIYSHLCAETILGHYYGFPSDINDRGQAVGYTEFEYEEGQYATFWDNGKEIILSKDASFAYGVKSRSQAVGWMSKPGMGRRAVLWDLVD